MLLRLTVLSFLSLTHLFFFFFFFNDTATTEIYTLSLHDALPIFPQNFNISLGTPETYSYYQPEWQKVRSEEHTSELQSQFHLVCRLLLEKKKQNTINFYVILSLLLIPLNIYSVLCHRLISSLKLL